MTSNKRALVSPRSADALLADAVALLTRERRRGRPWLRSLRQHVLIACALIS
jgi:hypothetical protein